MMAPRPYNQKKFQQKIAFSPRLRGEGKGGGTPGITDT
jgi:hypothetical protein